MVVAKRALANICQFPLYLLSKLIPRRRDIWVFGAWFGYRYSDNSRYVFDYVSENEPAIRAVWISRDKKVVAEVRESGKEAYLSGSWKGFWLCCRAYLGFITCGLPDLNRPGAYGTKKIQLWHGTPLKRIGLDDNVTRTRKRSAVFTALKRVASKLFPFTVETWDMIVSPSPVVSKRLETAFGADSSEVAVTGYPRGDVILSQKPGRVPALEEFLKQWKAKRVVCYMPTHRCEGREDFDLFMSLDVSAMNRCLAKHDAVMLVKMHYFHRTSAASETENSRIHWLSESELTDVNRLLPFVDILVTDYSSVFFDYLLLDRPMIFAPFDEDRYMKVDRQMYEDYDSVTPGPKCINWDEVILSIDAVFSGKDEYSKERKEAREKYNFYCDRNNCRRVTEMAKSVAGLPNSWDGGLPAKVAEEDYAAARKLIE